MCSITVKISQKMKFLNVYASVRLNLLKNAENMFLKYKFVCQFLHIKHYSLGSRKLSMKFFLVGRSQGSKIRLSINANLQSRLERKMHGSIT